MATRRQTRIAQIANELRAKELGRPLAEVPIAFKFGGSDVAVIMRAHRLEYRQRRAKGGVKPPARPTGRPGKPQQGPEPGD